MTLKLHRKFKKFQASHNSFLFIIEFVVNNLKKKTETGRKYHKCMSFQCVLGVLK